MKPLPALKPEGRDVHRGTCIWDERMGGTDLSYLSKVGVLPIMVLCHEDHDWMPPGFCTM
jgi:hypothetical protein